jgi:hypothetical protein
MFHSSIHNCGVSLIAPRRYTAKFDCSTLDMQHYNCADKSLARPTSRCRRTESIVSLEIHAILRETVREHAPSYATVKNGWPSLNVVIFPPFFPGRAKDLSALRYFVSTDVSVR